MSDSKTRRQLFAETHAHVSSARQSLESAITCAEEAKEHSWASRINQALEALGATPRQRRYRLLLIVTCATAAFASVAGAILVVQARVDSRQVLAKPQPSPTVQDTSCAVGNVEACYALAQRYAVGDGVAADVAKAAEYFQHACAAYQQNVKDDPALANSSYHPGAGREVCPMALMPRYAGMTTGQPDEVSFHEDECRLGKAWSCYQAGLYASSIPVPNRWAEQTALRACAAGYLQAACDGGIGQACKIAVHERGEAGRFGLPACACKLGPPDREEATSPYLTGCGFLDTRRGPFTAADIQRLRAESAGTTLGQ